MGKVAGFFKKIGNGIKKVVGKIKTGINKGMDKIATAVSKNKTLSKIFDIGGKILKPIGAVAGAIAKPLSWIPVVGGIASGIASGIGTAANIGGTVMNKIDQKSDRLIAQRQNKIVDPNVGNFNNRMNWGKLKTPLDDLKNRDVLGSLRGRIGKFPLTQNQLQGGLRIMK